MRSMLILAILVSLPTASAAVEGCHVNDAVCAYEYSDSFGTCDDGYSFGYTSVHVAGQVSVTGRAECYGYGGFGGGSSSIDAVTPFAALYWSEFHYSDPENGQFRGCYVYEASTGAYSALPCDVAAPPNPGWGGLLP